LLKFGGFVLLWLRLLAAKGLAEEETLRATLEPAFMILAPDPLILAGLRHTHAPVVFLDFDGVTHPDPPSGPVFTQLPLIEGVLRAYPKVLIVLSTTWRVIYPLAVLRKQFSSDISVRVLDSTPTMCASQRADHPALISRASRQAEVEAWLYENLTMAHPWIAIDDKAHWFEPGCRNLLVTNPNTGFTSADSARLRQMLKERLV
jgi:hypothetical protein